MSLHADPEDVVRRIADEFSVPQDVARRIIDPKILYDVIRATPAKIDVGRLLGTLVTIWLIAIILLPIMFFLMSLSFSAASHAWHWANF